MERTEHACIGEIPYPTPMALLEKLSSMNFLNLQAAYVHSSICLNQVHISLVTITMIYPSVINYHILARSVQHHIHGWIAYNCSWSDVLVFDTLSDASKHKDWFHIVSIERKVQEDFQAVQAFSFQQESALTQDSNAVGFVWEIYKKMVSIRFVDAIASRTS
jgi:hypothetical protein